MVSQSISVFFLLKNQEAFFRNEGRPLEREKSPLHTPPAATKKISLTPVVNNFTQTVSQWLWFRVLKQLSSSPPLRAWVPSVPVSITWWRKARRHASSKPRKWTFRIFSFLHPRRCMGDDDAIFSGNVVARCLTVQTSSTSIWKKKRAEEVTIFRFCSFSWRSAFVQSAISSREDHQPPFQEKVCAAGIQGRLFALQRSPSFRKNASWF